MTKKVMKKIIDNTPTEYYTLYKDTGFEGNKGFYFELQKNECREALIKILKSGNGEGK